MNSLKPRTLGGRGRTGSDSSGTIWHATDQPEYGLGPALCGAKPGRHSIGWSSWLPPEARVTCPRCLRAMEKSGA